MRRMEEARSNRFTQDIELGRDNEVCISGMERWCKNAEIKSEASGLYTEITGLPINPHSIGCPQVSGRAESMNIRWIVTDFLNEHCAGCPHHTPNGDTSWGQAIIDRYKEDEEERKRVKAEDVARLSALRDKLRSSARSFSEEIEPEAFAIVEHLQAVFSEDGVERTLASERVKQAAILGADIIPDAAIDMILELATRAEFAGMMLPVCQELAVTHHELGKRLEEVALGNIERNLQVELSAALVDSLGDSLNYPLSEEHITRLMLSQDHTMFKFISPYKEPEYVHITSVLARSFDADPESIRSVIRHHLMAESERERYGLCGALELIQRRRPAIVDNLLDDLLNSLTMDESDINESPSSQIKRILKSAYRSSPEHVDEFISSKMKRVRQTIQEDLVQVYENVFRDARNLEFSESSKSVDIAVDRLLEWMSDDHLDLEVRVKAVEALKEAVRYFSSTMLKRFNSIFGYLAIVSASKSPSPSPSIILPGQPPVSPQTQEMEKYFTDKTWYRFKRRIQECLEELCRREPQSALEPIAECYSQSLDHIESDLKVRCVPLLCQIGKDYRLRPQVMPYIWKAMTDYSSTLSIAEAIDAVTKMYPRSVRPPANLIEMVVIYLGDPYVVIHKAARRAVARHPHWFDDTQIDEILGRLAAQLEVYAGKPFDIEEISEAVLNIGARHQRTKLQAYALVAGSYPTAEEYVDKNILKAMMRHCKPDEVPGKYVARKISDYLGIHGRDRFSTYEYSERFQMFEWLQGLPEYTFREIAGDLTAAAKSVAKRDAWESANFASLFAQFQDFGREGEVFVTALDSISDEPRHKESRSLWRDLADAAKDNAILRDYI